MPHAATSLETKGTPIDPEHATPIASREKRGHSCFMIEVVGPSVEGRTQDRAATLSSVPTARFRRVSRDSH